MHEAGLVEFAPEERVVRLTGTGADVEVRLDDRSRERTPVAPVFLSLSPLSVVAVVAAATGVPGLAAVPGLVLAGLLAAAFPYDSTYRMRPGRRGRPPGRVDRN